METPAQGRAERVVLVVDDDDFVRHYMVRAFTEAGYRILVAANGRQALTVLSSLDATVILAVVTDFLMPGMDGLQLAATISEQWPMIPLLLVSGRPPEAWAGAFLPKPFSPPDLVAAVERLVPPQAGGAPP